MPKPNPPPRLGTTAATSRSGRSGPCSSAGTADSRTGRDRTRPASTGCRRAQPDITVRTSANAVKSRAGSPTGIQPSSSRTPPTDLAASQNSAITARGLPMPSPRATSIPGRTRSASLDPAGPVTSAGCASRSHRQDSNGRGAGRVANPEANLQKVAPRGCRNGSAGSRGQRVVPVGEQGADRRDQGDGLIEHDVVTGDRDLDHRGETAQPVVHDLTQLR